jgi:hypothetical protein
MNPLPALLVLTTTAFASVASVASAAPLERYFASTDTCYGRSYSGDHLRKHPQQQVVDMAISHFPSKQELLGMESPFQPYPETPSLVLQLNVWLRGQDKGWQQGAICKQEGDKLRCGFECDGGTFYVSEQSKDRLLLTLDEDLYFTQCDAGEAILQKTAEDRSFLLYPMPRSHCSAD